MLGYSAGESRNNQLAILPFVSELDFGREGLAVLTRLGNGRQASHTPLRLVLTS